MMPKYLWTLAVLSTCLILRSAALAQDTLLAITHAVVIDGSGKPHCWMERSWCTTIEGRMMWNLLIEAETGEPPSGQRLRISSVPNLTGERSDNRSRSLQGECEHNKNRYYVPEWLLEEWSITVDPTFSDAA
jgi:hypothetical protein